MRDDIVCVGEILWDALPAGLFLGGAPFNVARHLHVLGASVAFVSRLGDDRLGDEARRRLRAQGLDDTFVQTGHRPTGFVRVALDADTGEPDYEILEPVAWDAIAWTEALRTRAEEAAAVVFGSLAQRSSTSRRTIRRLCQADVLRVFDVNLRPPYVERAVVEQSLQVADVVKLNDEELRRLQSWFDLATGTEEGMAALAAAFDCDTVCVTGGSEGAHLWRHGAYWHHPGYDVVVEDTVGAGDAFLSALLAGLLAETDANRLLERANRLGAYVASHFGAVPDYTVDALADLSDLPVRHASKNN